MGQTYDGLLKENAALRICLALADKVVEEAGKLSNEIRLGFLSTWSGRLIGKANDTNAVIRAYEKERRG